MTYIKINDTLYPAAITGRLSDPNWGGRSSKTIRLEMAASTATELFINDVHWSIVEDYIDAEEMSSKLSMTTRSIALPEISQTIAMVRCL